MIAAIDKKLELDRSPEDVWKALTDPIAVAGWFGDTASFAPELGGEGWFGWESHGSFSMRIEDFDPPKRLSWRWAREADKPLTETHSTLVEWTLLPREDGGTTLLLKESGFATEESRQDNVGGWKQELQHLVEFLSGG
jgi:uncharacterized protein YndB with AHSA1/START domain